MIHAGLEPDRGLTTVGGMAEITIEPGPAGMYEVTVSEGGSSSSHIVTVDLARDGVDDEDLVEASFRFLLDREPKESILSRFELSVISRYFPEYGDRIGDYL